MTAAPGFDWFAPGAMPAVLLFGTRVTGLLLVAPALATRPVPMKVRTGLLVLLVALLLPVVRTPAGLMATPATILGEAIVGFTIGLGAALIVGAAELAGELLAIQVGLQGSAIMDPMSAQQSTAVGQFLNLFAIALLLTLNLHVVMLDALRASVDRVPVGGALAITEGLWAILGTVTTLFVLGLRFAAPVIALVLLLNVALAMLSRAAPQLQILALAFPLQILAGLAALIALVPILGSWFLGWDVPYAELVGRGLAPFLAGSR